MQHILTTVHTDALFDVNARYCITTNYVYNYSHCTLSMLFSMRDITLTYILKTSHMCIHIPTETSPIGAHMM